MATEPINIRLHKKPVRFPNKKIAPKGYVYTHKIRDASSGVAQETI